MRHLRCIAITLLFVAARSAFAEKVSSMPTGYVMDSRNPNSRFHLALHVSYPNAEDRARAKNLGQPSGGDIMVHGVESKFRWLGGLQHDVDWTDGCIAVTDKEMDEIWKAVPLGTPIEIRR